MKFDRLDRVFSRTDGHCHICCKRLCFGNHGAIGKQGAWEIEHSRPRSRGGTDHLNNLYAACISCNRAAPLSKQKKQQNALKWGIAGSLAALFVPPPLRLVALVAGAAAGALLGHDYEPE